MIPDFDVTYFERFLILVLLYLLYRKIYPRNEQVYDSVNHELKMQNKKHFDCILYEIFALIRVWSETEIGYKNPQLCDTLETLKKQFSVAAQHCNSSWFSFEGWGKFLDQYDHLKQKCIEHKFPFQNINIQLLDLQLMKALRELYDSKGSSQTILQLALFILSSWLRRVFHPVIAFCMPWFIYSVLSQYWVLLGKIFNMTL